MAQSVTPDAISTILANPSPDSSSDLPEIIVQVLDLKPAGNRYTFSASDGKTKVRAIFPPNMSTEIMAGGIQNKGFLKILNYTLNDIPNKSEKYLVVTKCEVAASALDTEIQDEVKTEESDVVLKRQKLENEVKAELKTEGAGIVLKPKQEIVSKSAAQIVYEQRENMAPSIRMAMSRRVHPLVSLNPYQGNWTIKVRLTSKGNMRTYKNARGEGCVFNVELTDEDVI